MTDSVAEERRRGVMIGNSVVWALIVVGTLAVGVLEFFATAIRKPEPVAGPPILFYVALAIAVVGPAMGYGLQRLAWWLGRREGRVNGILWTLGNLVYWGLCAEAACFATVVVYLYHAYFPEAIPAGLAFVLLVLGVPRRATLGRVSMAAGETRAPAPAWVLMFRLRELHFGGAPHRRREAFLLS